MPPGPPDMGKLAAFYERYGLRVVGGLDHDYERFASQRLDDIRDDSRGLRQSVAGTGGGTQHAFGEIQPNS